jgi:hypothetical protein
MKLYEISDDYMRTLEGVVIDEDTGEIIDITGNLPVVREHFIAKAKNVAYVFSNLDAEIAAIKKAEGMMTRRRKRLESESKKIRLYLKNEMQRTGISKVDCEYFSIKVKKNPPHVKVLNEKLIPAIYKTVEIMETIDKSAIRDAIKAGVEVPGAILENDTKLDVK